MNFKEIIIENDKLIDYGPSELKGADRIYTYVEFEKYGRLTDVSYAETVFGGKLTDFHKTGNACTFYVIARTYEYQITDPMREKDPRNTVLGLGNAAGPIYTFSPDDPLFKQAVSYIQKNTNSLVFFNKYKWFALAGVPLLAFVLFEINFWVGLVYFIIISILSFFLVPMMIGKWVGKRLTKASRANVSTVDFATRGVERFKYMEEILVRIPNKRIIPMG